MVQSMVLWPIFVVWVDDGKHCHSPKFPPESTLPVCTCCVFILASCCDHIKCIGRVWCRVLSRKFLLYWIKSCRPIKMLQQGLDQGLISVHSTKASIPGAAQPTGVFMNNWFGIKWMETLLIMRFYPKAKTAFIDMYSVTRKEIIMYVSQSQRQKWYTYSHVLSNWTNI